LSSLSVRFPSVCLSVRMEQLGFQWTNFCDIGCLSIFRKSKMSRITVTLHKDLRTFMITTRRILLKMRSFSYKILEKIKTHLLCPFFPPENLTVYDTLWKNMVEQDRSQMTVRRIRTACWIIKITDALPEYVIIISFPRQIFLRNRASVSCYTSTYTACLAKGQNETADGLSSIFRHI
jgi:hypothetical protein